MCSSSLKQRMTMDVLGWVPIAVSWLGRKVRRLRQTTWRVMQPDPCRNRRGMGRILRPSGGEVGRKKHAAYLYDHRTRCRADPSSALVCRRNHDRPSDSTRALAHDRRRSYQTVHSLDRHQLTRFLSPPKEDAVVLGVKGTMGWVRHDKIEATG